MLLGHVGASRGPVERRKRELGRDRGRREFNRTSEGALGGSAISLQQLQRSQIRVGVTPNRIQADRFLEMRDPRLEVPQSGQRVTEQHLCRNVLRVFLQRRFGTLLRLLELAGGEQKATGFDLRLRILRQ